MAPQRYSNLRESEDVILEKQSILLDLDRLKLRGVRLTKEYNLNDNIDDMSFELKRHLAHQEEETTVSMMRDAMRIMCTGIELGNNKLGPFLELDGWSAEVCSDINKYDSALSKLYRKHWRRGSSSPETEILMGMAGSLGLYHFKKKFSQGVDNGFASRGGGGGGGGGGGLSGLGGIASMFSGLMGGGGGLGRRPSPSGTSAGSVGGGSASTAPPTRTYDSSTDEEAPGNF